MGKQPNLKYRTVHVEGRTPGPRGKANMVTVQDGQCSPPGAIGSHHEAVYIAAFVALSEALRDGDPGLNVTTPSDHLVEHMNGQWNVGDELSAHHLILIQLAGLFGGGVTWSKAPRTSG